MGAKVGKRYEHRRWGHVVVDEITVHPSGTEDYSPGTILIHFHPLDGDDRNGPVSTVYEEFRAATVTLGSNWNPRLTTGAGRL